MKEDLESFLKNLESLQKEVGLTIKSGSQSIKRGIFDEGTFFIGLLWEKISDWININDEVLGLAEIRDGKLFPFDPESILREMEELYSRSKEFPPSKLRSYATKLSEHFVRKLLLDAKETHPEKLLKYQELLSQDSRYWFRRTAAEHLQTGMHTAISANFKMISAAVLAGENSDLSLSETLKLIDKALDAAHYLSTCHMAMLHAADGVLWDSAGFMEPKGWSEEGGILYLSSSASKHSSDRFREAEPVFFEEERIGCPALGAKTPLRGNRVASEVRNWCLDLSKKFYLPLIWTDENSLRS